MTNAPGPQLIEWLEHTSNALAKRAEGVGQTSRTIARLGDGLIFRAPAGARVQASAKLFAGSLRSVEEDLRELVVVCRQEALRLRNVHARGEALAGQAGAAVGGTFGRPASPEGQLFAQDRDEWERTQFPAPTNRPAPAVDVPEADDQDGPYGPSDKVGRGPAFAAQFAALSGEPVSTHYELDLGNVRRTSEGFAKTANACVTHQSAVLRILGELPPPLRRELRMRLTKSRRIDALVLERSSRRLKRQSTLLHTRAETPGLVDGAFTTDLAPVLQVPAGSSYEWVPTNKVGHLFTLTEQSQRLQDQAHELNWVMTRLLRRVPVIYGRLPAGWWKPIGCIHGDGENQRPVWGAGVDPALAALATADPIRPERVPEPDGKPAATPPNDDSGANVTQPIPPTGENPGGENPGNEKPANGGTGSANENLGGTDGEQPPRNEGSDDHEDPVDDELGGENGSEFRANAGGDPTGEMTGDVVNLSGEGVDAGGGAVGDAAAGGGGIGGAVGGWDDSGGGGEIGGYDDGSTAFDPLDAGAEEPQRAAAGAAAEPKEPKTGAPTRRTAAEAGGGGLGISGRHAAAGGLAVAAGSAGGLALSSKRAKSRVLTWASYVSGAGENGNTTEGIS